MEKPREFLWRDDENDVRKWAMILPVHGFQQILPLAKVTDTTAKTRKSKTIFVISLLSDDSESH